MEEMDLRSIEVRETSEANQSADPISHLALDIGGSLVKLVYFSKNKELPTDHEVEGSSKKSSSVSNGQTNGPVVAGKLHFAKFESSKMEDCLEFIQTRKIHLNGCRRLKALDSDRVAIKATGGGAYKYADRFKEKLGIYLDKEDEMDCLVAGANFLLKVISCEINPRLLKELAVHQEAFTYMDGCKEFVQLDQNDMYPYLLVNIGSGVSMIKVDEDGKFERVSGTSVGGGTFWGLGSLLTKCNSFDELLELSHRGNNRAIDMLVGDIYGGMDYAKFGLMSTTIASSFGKAISDNKNLEDYKPEDISRSLLRLVSNNIGQIAYLNALRFGIKRIFFGGFFIRGHAFTMDTISVAVHFWSKGEAKAMFLRHEGFLGALGAFLSYKKHDSIIHQIVQPFPRASFAGTEIHKTINGEADTYETIECCVYES